MTATISGTEAPVSRAIPAATGTSATTVPTLVPIESEMKHAATNSPGSSKLEGSTWSAIATVASMLPMALADEAKAPANTYIHSMSSKRPEPAPRL